MTRNPLIGCFAMFTLICAGAAPGAPPVVSGLSTASAPISGRFIISGTGFGVAGPGSGVEIGGTAVPFTRWGDASITAYVLGTLAPGPSVVRVVTPEGASNPMAFTVTPLPPAQEHLAWRFQADSRYFLHRPAVGGDGTVYAQDIRGFVYAIDRAGGLRWIHNAGGYPGGGGGEGPVALLQDGTVVVTGNPLGPEANIVAINPDGTRRWTFSDTNTQGVIAGPNVGPDGNIYFVTDLGGRGVASITPTGQLRWSDTWSPAINENGQTGEEIVFGPRNPGEAADQFYCAFDMRSTGVQDTLFGISLSGNFRFAALTGGQGDPLAQRQGQPTVGPDGSVYICANLSTAGWRLQKFNPASGERVWAHFPTGTNSLSEPDAGHDGTVFVTRNLAELRAVTPAGSERWAHTGTVLLFAPIAGPAGSPVIVGGRNGFGEPGFVKAFDYATGAHLWTLPLPTEGGLSQIPYTRAKFAPGGGRAYIGSTLPGQPNGQEYCYLLALDTAPACAADFNGDGGVNSQDFFDFLAAFFAGDGAADFNRDGAVNSQDLFDFLGAFFAGC